LATKYPYSYKLDLQIMMINITGAITVILVASQFVGCATDSNPRPKKWTPDIPNLRDVEIPQSLPETKLRGKWSSGDGFHSDVLTLKASHRFSETTMSDISTGPYSMSGVWEFTNRQVILHPVREADKTCVQPLLVVRCKGNLVLLPNGSGLHNEGWALSGCYQLESRAKP